MQRQNIILQLERYDYQDIRSDKHFRQCVEEASGTPTADEDDIVVMSDKIFLMNQFRGWDNM